MYYAEVGVRQRCGLLPSRASDYVTILALRSWVHAAQSVSYHLPWLH